jgi:uncharacterized protein
MIEGAHLEQATIPQDLVRLIRRQFALPLYGIHGEAHWARVCANGLWLAKKTGADPQVVEFFAYLHDAKRQNDGWDREHGSRAAAFLLELDETLLPLSPQNLGMLAYACTHHSDGLIEADVTVQTCWDADRLDLGRIGIRPDPGRLCTAAAREPATIEWAFQRSQTRRSRSE